jgi:hypothetical protein
MIYVRPYEADDRTFVLNLAPRLLIGMPAWRDPQLWLTTFQNWIAESIEQYEQTAMVLVAEDDQGERLGFATLGQTTHFTGERQAYIKRVSRATESLHSVPARLMSAHSASIIISAFAMRM